MEISDYAIKKLKNRQLHFEEEDTIFKKEMAEVLTARDDNELAAKTLESINLEQSNREIKPAEKADVWLSIAENWFEADDSVNAEKFINKCAHVMHLFPNERPL